MRKKQYTKLHSIQQAPNDNPRKERPYDPNQSKSIKDIEHFLFTTQPILKDYLGMNILAFNLNISCFQTLFNFFPSKLSTKFIKEQFSIPSSFSSHRGQLKRVSLIMEGNTQTMPDK